MGSESKTKKKASSLTFTRKKGQGFKIGDEYLFRFIDTTKERVEVQITLPDTSKYEVKKVDADAE